MRLLTKNTNSQADVRRFAHKLTWEELVRLYLVTLGATQFATEPEGSKSSYLSPRTSWILEGLVARSGLVEPWKGSRNMQDGNIVALNEVKAR